MITVPIIPAMIAMIRRALISPERRLMGRQDYWLGKIYGNGFGHG